MISNDEFRECVITEIKAHPVIMATLPNQDEVRESQWQGDVFVYPNLRVRTITNEPRGPRDCFNQITFGIQVFSEEKSSLEAERISGIISEELHETSFSHNGVRVSLRATNLVPALRNDLRTWRSEVLFTAIAS